MLDRYPVAFEINSPPTKTGDLTPPESIICSHHDWEFNRIPMHCCNQFLRFFRAIEIRVMLYRLWLLDPIHRIYTNEIHFQRIFECAHQIRVVVDHGIIADMQNRLAVCIEFLNLNSFYFAERNTALFEKRHNSFFDIAFVSGVRVFLQIGSYNFQPIAHILRKRHLGFIVHNR